MHNIHILKFVSRKKLPFLKTTFPDKWKEAYIVPVFKKGSRSLPSNYRAILITSFFGKLLEDVLRDALFTHV